MISVVTTGGTIACTTDPQGALVPTVTGQELIDATGLPPRDVRVRDLLRVDSSSLTLPDLDAIIAGVHEELADPAVRGVVLTHGTDSLEETALALSLLHPDPDKSVVITGAQRAFDRPDSDGVNNLVAAIEKARLSTGTHVVFGGDVLPARGLTKAHTDDLRAFSALQRYRSTPPPLKRVPLAGTRVPVIAAYPGAPGEVIEKLADGADGIVIQALGSGNMSVGCGEAAAHVLASGRPVVVATRVPFGRVHLAYGGPGGGATLADKGALASNGLSAGQARIALIIALATGTDPAEVF